MAKKYKKAPMLVLPDSNERIEKFVNYIMKNGKKLLAKKIFNMTLKEIEKNGHPNPLVVWEQAIENASPSIMVKSKRIG
jgi:small subunit ribosomal protein S7